MILTFQPVRVAIAGDEEAVLVFADERLVALLLHLSEDNDVAPSAWYFEAGFGHGLDGPTHPTFSSLDEAQDWIGQRLALRSNPLTHVNGVN